MMPIYIVKIEKSGVILENNLGYVKRSVTQLKEKNSAKSAYEWGKSEAVEIFGSSDGFSIEVEEQPAK